MPTIVQINPYTTYPPPPNQFSILAATGTVPDGSPVGAAVAVFSTPFGTITGDLNDEVIEAFYYATGAHYVGLFVVGSQSQTGLFTELEFTDRLGATVTLVAADATGFTDFGGDTLWQWDLASNPFTPGNTYTVLIS